MESSVLDTTSSNIESRKGFEHYKPIRNKLRKFDKTKLLYKLIEELHAVKERYDSYQKNQGLILDPHREFQPWCALLAIRWLLIDWDCQNNSKKEPTGTDIKNIVNQIMKFRSDPDTLEDIKNEKDIIKIVRSHSMQQRLFSYNWCNDVMIGRVYKLFLETNLKSEVERIFKNHSKIDLPLDTFLKIAFYAYFLSMTGRPINKSTFRQLKNHKELEVSEEDVDKFFNITSLTITEAAKYCQKKTKDDYHRQYFELSPLIFYPFLNIEEKKWIAWSPSLIQEYLIQGIYDFCKEKEKSSFCGKFGRPIFEEYLAESMQNNGIKSFMDEDELSSKGLKKKKKVDFVIPSNKGNILIEAKAIEADPVTSQPTVDMCEAYKENLVKAVAQGLSVAKYIQQGDVHSITNAKNYLLIVTYEEPFLGPSKVNWEESCPFKGAWDEFISECLDKEFPKVPKDAIDPKNIYFLSVDDFDRLMSLGCINRIIEKLDEIAEKNLTRPFTLSASAGPNPKMIIKSSHFCFGQHLGNVEKVGQLQVLKELYEEKIMKPFLKIYRASKNKKS